MSADVTVLGLGVMGRALASALLSAGHRVSVWNRTPGRADDLLVAGAVAAASATEAIEAGKLIIVCVLDDGVVHELLSANEAVVGGRTVINLTTGTPEQARELATWAADHEVGYLDGGIMAVPAMIGQPGSSILYSGSAEVFEQHRPLLELFGTAEFFGEDAGLASLYDLAMLAGMYAMFAGALQATAMVRSAGGTATDFAERLVPFLRAMAGSISVDAEIIDAENYANGVQDLRFTKAAVDTIVAASKGQGVGTELLEPIRTLIQRQIDLGHGGEDTARMFESIGGVATRH